MIDLDLLHKRVEEGYVNVQHHPTADLHIFNYSPKTQYEQVWDEATKAARGLILDGAGNVVARPFPKFFNLEEHPRSDIVFSKPFTVTDKMDGSLGIMYWDGHRHCIATRGSFTSEQAIKATEILNAKYTKYVSDLIQNRLDVTFLFEIIYPSNRIVVNYGNMEDLILLAAIDIKTGRDIDWSNAWQDIGWPGPSVKKYDVSCKPREVIEATYLVDAGNHEGVVLRFDWPKEGPNTRVKVKLEEYKRLHRILTGVSTKTVWELLANGRSLDDLLDRVPDEFNDWLKKTVNDLYACYWVILFNAGKDFEKIVAELGKDFSRKDFAAKATQTKYPSLMFMHLDQQFDRANQAIWKMLRPEYAKPFKVDVDA